jgi:processive 1,2-diacylglycerol beta-glucosyltransferase
MRTEYRILILYASYGDGHYQVSKALQQCFLAKGAAQVRLLDLMAEAHPVVNAVTRQVYLKGSKYCPHFYGWCYELTKNMKHDGPWGRGLNLFGSRRLVQIIEDEDPDVVIQTFPLQIMPELRWTNKVDIPTFTVLTDFVLHRRWVHPGTDKYYVATEALKKTMVAEGVPSSRIRVSGIPIRESFCQPVSKGDVLRRFGLDHSRRNILVMAGAYGVLSDLRQLIGNMLQLDNVRILVVCGKNEGLMTTIRECFAAEPHVRIFGFVDQVHELMSVSFCMITKAGGITLSEAIAMSVPTIIYRPLPGQETGNALFLEQQGAAFVARHVREVLEQVRGLLLPGGQAEAMKRVSRALGRAGAAGEVAEDILLELDRRKEERAALTKQDARMPEVRSLDSM